MSCPVIELTQQLIRRPSLSPDDAGCQALLIERLQAIGFTVERMDFADSKFLGIILGFPRSGRRQGIQWSCI